VIESKTIDDDCPERPNSTRWYAGEEDDQSAAVRLVIAERLNELLPIEDCCNCSSSISLQSSYGNLSFLLVESFGGEGAIWETKPEDKCPAACDGSENDEHVLPAEEGA